MHTGKSVEPAHLQQLLETLPPELRDEAFQLRERLFNPPWLHADLSQIPEGPPSNLSARHTAALAEAGIIEAAAAHPASRANSAFLVAEEKVLPSGETQIRLRPIVWTRVTNDYDREWAREDNPRASEVRLPKIYQLEVDDEHRRSGGVDLVAAYFQVLIPEGSRKAFRFVCQEGKTWQMTRLPMGTSLAAALVQRITVAVSAAGDWELARATMTGAAADRTSCEPRLTVYIDNLRVQGSPTAVRCHLARVRCFAAVHGVTLRDEFGPDDARYVFLGVEFAGGECRPGPKTRQNLGTFADNVVLTPQSLATIEAATGRARWAAMALQYHLAGHLSAVMALRWAVNLLSRAADPSSVVVFRRDVAEAIAVLMRELASATREPPRCGQDERTTLYTDASYWGYGAVLTSTRGQLFSLGAAWGQAEADRWGWRRGHVPHINVLECVAAAEGVMRMLEAGELEEVSSLALMLDSTAAIGALRRGWTPEPTMAAAVHWVRAELRRRRINWTVGHVSSKENPADAPSRGRRGVSEGEGQAGMESQRVNPSCVWSPRVNPSGE